MSRRPDGVLKDLLRAAGSDRVTGLAAELTFFAVFSLFPGLLFVAGALGFLDQIVGRHVASLSEQAVLVFLHQILTEKGQAVIDSVRDLFESQGGGLVTLAAFIALYTLTTGFASLIGALDFVYGVQERRSWLRIRAVALALALGSVVMLAFILTFIVVGPLLGLGDRLGEMLGMGRVFSFAWNWMRPPLASCLLVLWVTTLYHMAPNRRTPWLRELPGGVVAAVLLLAFSYGFGLYLQLAASANKILGVLGGGLILMTWLYALSLSVLLGGVLNAVLARRRSVSS